MKKLLLILTLSCIAFIVNAQTEKIKGYLYGTGGVNWGTFFQSSRDVSSIKGVWGPEADLSFRVVYPTWLGYEIGVNYSGKGAKFSDSLGSVHLNYAGAYVNGMMYFPLINNDDAYIGAGVYFAGAINGTTGINSAKQDIKFDGNNWTRADIGMQLKGGYVIKNTVGFGFQYSLGLVPAYTGKDLAGKVTHARNSAFSFFLTLKLAKIFEKPFSYD
jgi:hypothetical protein